MRSAVPVGRQAVLIVEDNPVEQKLIAFLVNRLGYESQVVGTGHKAIALMSTEHDYCAVLMNWTLPVMDGLECTYLIRGIESAQGRRTPIIGVTARASEEARKDCLEAGMDDYLSKPFAVADFEEMLRRWAPVPEALWRVS